VIQLLDSTLREGEQTPGVYFDGHIKLAIAELLDEIGIDIIEAGHPMVTPEIFEAVRQITNHNLNAKIGAHSRSLEADIDLALECGVDFLGIFYCVSDERLNHVFKKDLNNAIDQIARVIAYAKAMKPELSIRYTPEDTVRSKFENVVEASVAAIEAGADIISIADTTGFMIPGSEHNMFEFISNLKQVFDKKNLSPKIAVHCHNDRGLAMANAMDAIRAGAEIVDVSVLGLGERAGIVDMAQLLNILQNSSSDHSRWKLEKLPQLYQLVSKYAGVPVPVHFPLVGKNAFTHCAGVHTHAAVKNPTHYQSIDPSLVGRKMDVSLDHMSGISSVQWALEILEIEVDNELLERILDIIKSIGQKGRTVDLTELHHIMEWCKKHPAAEKLYI
jgi:2-isopropylmalate synthase